MQDGVTASAPGRLIQVAEVKVWETDIQSATYRPTLNPATLNPAALNSVSTPSSK
jgi:hypothetical protein